MSPFSIGNTSSKGPFSIATLDYQRVTPTQNNAQIFRQLPSKLPYILAWSLMPQAVPFDDLFTYPEPKNGYHLRPKQPGNASLLPSLKLT